MILNNALITIIKIIYIALYFCLLRLTLWSILGVNFLIQIYFFKSHFFQTRLRFLWRNRVHTIREITAIWIIFLMLLNSFRGLLSLIDNLIQILFNFYSCFYRLVNFYFDKRGLRLRFWRWLLFGIHSSILIIYEFILKFGDEN